MNRVVCASLRFVSLAVLAGCVDGEDPGERPGRVVRDEAIDWSTIPTDIREMLDPVCQPFYSGEVDVWCGTAQGAITRLVARSDDARPADAGTADAGARDAGPPDAGTADAGARDAGPPDAGTVDAGARDAGPPDGGTADAGARDARAEDGGVDEPDALDAGLPDAPPDECQALRDLERSCYWTALALLPPPDDPPICTECNTCPTSDTDADVDDGAPPLEVKEAARASAPDGPKLMQSDLDTGAARALGTTTRFDAKVHARLLQKILEANAPDLVAMVDAAVCDADEVLFFGGIQGFQTPADRQICERDSPRKHGREQIEDYDLLKDDPDSDDEKRGDNLWSPNSASSRLRDHYGTDLGVGNLYWDYAWRGISDKDYDANFTGSPLKKATIYNYYNASSGAVAANGLITSPTPQLLTRREGKRVNERTAIVVEHARLNRYKSYLGDKSDVRVLGAIANMPDLRSFVNADSTKLTPRVHDNMVWKAEYAPWLKADIDDLPKHWSNLAPDWMGEAMYSVLRAYKCGQPILAHSGGGASLAYVVRMVDAYVRVANKAATVARWDRRNLRVIGLEAAMSIEGAAMLQRLPTFATKAGVVNYAGNTYLDKPFGWPSGTVTEKKWVDWSAGNPKIAKDVTVAKAAWRGPTWNGTIRVAVYHQGGTLMETEAVNPDNNAITPSSLWVHADMSTSTQRYGWVAGRSAWKANYKIEDLLTRPLSGDVNAALLSRAHGRYVVAENNGGTIVNANRVAAGAWETFAIHDINGGELQSTDPIYIGTSAGWFFCADHTLTRDFPWQDWRVVWRLNATRRNTDAWERMTIYKINAARLAAGVYETTAGDIVDGDFVIIQSYAGNFMVAEANGAANVNRPNFNAWEVFQFKKK